jgi:hypothetical protein
LNHGFCEVVREDLLYRTDLLVIIGMIEQIGGTISHGTMSGMPVMIRARHIDLILFLKVHIDLGTPCQIIRGISVKGFHNS